MEGLKEAMKYLVEELSVPHTREHEGVLFSDKKMHRVHQEQPVAQPFIMTTLSSFIDYIRSNTDKMREKMIIHVESPVTVSLQSMLDEDRIREKVAVVRAKIPDFSYEWFYPSEEFTIKMMAQFVDHDGDTDKELLLKYAGTTQAGTVRDYGDDGVSQSAVIQQTLSSKEEVIIPNPVTLRPYGRHMECFTYSELYTMKVAVCDKERIYNELPEEQKQAFDHCLDLGQVKEAREILVEHERSKRNESDHEISREQVVPGKLDHQTLP